MLSPSQWLVLSTLVLLWLLFMIAVSCAALKIQRQYFTRNWQSAFQLFRAPEEMTGGWGWNRGFVRDKPGGYLCLFRIKCVEKGVLVREHNLLTLMRVVKPRVLLLPWHVITGARQTKVPWHVSLSVEEPVELDIQDSQITVVLLGSLLTEVLRAKAAATCHNNNPNA